MKGKLKGVHAPLSMKYAIWGMLSGTVSILAILAVTKMAGYPLLIGSFGASAVLLFGANESPLAQPRNLIGGHLVSALVAVVIVALGGATALIGVQGHAGYVFLLLPVLAGVLILLVVALFTNNVVHHRQYPKHWI